MARSLDPKECPSQAPALLVEHRLKSGLTRKHSLARYYDKGRGWLKFTALDVKVGSAGHCLIVRRA